MALSQGFLFLVLGGGLLLVDYQSLHKGWLPFGANWLRGRLKFSRDEQPGLYWMAFIIYGAGGAWLLIFALRLLAGAAAPLPLR